MAPDSGKLPLMMTEEDLARLRAKLSSVTRKRLEGKPPVEQAQLVVGWLRQGPWRPDEDRRMRGPLPKDDDDRIADFFEKDLSPDERDRLLAMPGDEMQWRLQEMYLTRTRSPEGPGRRSDGPRRNRRPGDAEPRMPWPPAQHRSPSWQVDFFASLTLHSPSPMTRQLSLQHPEPRGHTVADVAQLYCHSQCAPISLPNPHVDRLLCKRWQEFHNHGNFFINGRVAAICIDLFA